jgi:adenine-specific DNA-methyltransferase
MIKYMGAKTRLLGNGLGAILENELHDVSRFVDLFSGSAVVAWHVAQRYDIPVTAVDLQSYSAALAAAVLHRTGPIDKISGATRVFSALSSRFGDLLQMERQEINQLSDTAFIRWIKKARSRGDEGNSSTLRTLYGGHYFSPRQCEVLEASVAGISDVVRDGPVITACAIYAASRCSASTGHTAQPLSPNLNSARWIRNAWSINPIDVMRRGLARLSPLFARRRGSAVIKDAIETARSCTSGDLVFLDPPYSSVHYSRFYHVLESIATGWRGSVYGTGRYPHPTLRPQSEFSVRSTAFDAMGELLDVLAERRSRLVITYPVHECSNGLSAALIEKLGAKHFSIARHPFSGQFSTLGGDNAHRSARQDATEAVLVFRPKRQSSRRISGSKDLIAVTNKPSVLPASI